jgi:hypothetical protein
MFGNVLYFDEKKFREYKSIAIGKKNLRVDNIEISNDKGISINLPVLGADAKSTKNYGGIIEESLLFDCNEFETLLNGRDDYFDFTMCDDFDLLTLQRGYIIKFNSYLRITESFDFTQLIEQFKPMIIEQLSAKMERTEQQAFEKFFAVSDAKIPLLSELDNIALCSKIDARYLQISYNQLEDYESVDVTILARMISNSMINKSKSIYDPLKDFMTLNRATRRNITNDRPDGLQELYSEEDYMNIEIVAIYQ